MTFNELGSILIVEEEYTSLIKLKDVYYARHSHHHFGSHDPLPRPRRPCHGCESHSSEGFRARGGLDPAPEGSGRDRHSEGGGSEVSRESRILELSGKMKAIQSEIDKLVQGEFVPYETTIKYNWGHSYEKIYVRNEAEEAVVGILKAYMQIRYCSRSEALRSLCGRTGKFQFAVRAIVDDKHYSTLRQHFKRKVAEWNHAVNSKNEECERLLTRI